MSLFKPSEMLSWRIRHGWFNEFGGLPVEGSFVFACGPRERATARRTVSRKNGILDPKNHKRAQPLDINEILASAAMILQAHDWSSTGVRRVPKRIHYILPASVMRQIDDCLGCLRSDTDSASGFGEKWVHSLC